MFIVAFDKVECKSNFDLWLSRVGCPVHGSRLKNPHSHKDTKMGIPALFLQGHVMASKLVALLRHVKNL